MRRLSGLVLAGAMLILPAFAQPAVAQQAPQKFTISGDMAVLMVSVKGDKTADYEQVLGKLKDALMKSEAPEAKQQLAGWKIVKTPMPQPDGTIVYLHIITPVAGADYSVLQNIYTVVKDPTEQKAIYDQYVGTGAKNLSLLTGSVALDMGK
ncbi:MAG TPA: hypothetical protein VL173_05785, partial [Vicinamibacterales bacterium]|nr:hypothetical protein [Vicinamibacterales bacterium]